MGCISLILAFGSIKSLDLAFMTLFDDLLTFGSFSFIRFLDRKVLINDELPGQILKGRLSVKADLRAFQGSGVLFEDGSVEENIHAVVFCTGYRSGFSFLPPDLGGGPHGDPALYR